MKLIGIPLLCLLLFQPALGEELPQTQSFPICDVVRGEHYVTCKFCNIEKEKILGDTITVT